MWRIFVALVLAAGLAAPAAALPAEEVLKLKQAGVSDATIQRMLEQERQGGAGGGPVRETNDAVTYGAGQNTPEKVRQHEQRERWKEEKSMEMLRGVILDQRQGPTGQTNPR
jgi:hypothetical protein